MKKIIFSALCLLVLAGSVSAQHRRYYPRNRPHQGQQPISQNKVKFDIIGGLNVSNVVNVNDYNFSTGTLAGFHAGAGIEVPFNTNFAFEPEVLYSGKGYSAATNTGQFNQRTNWIDVPFLLKVKPIPNFNFVFGPQISFLLSTQNTFKNGYSSQTQTLYNSATDGYNKTLIGGVVGVGLELNPNVELRARYTIDLQSTAITGVSDISQYNNQVWQIGLAVKFF
ncbi:outer membrane protein with beta-barrel domain [Mucilaginibacter gracilis]|uniref:Outer membrane protein with beta-barrel domain n=1 Tax=Mucilaginibacter gracilis TaxID=423350 RepID=A0A495IXZ8_9SPHI|nr:porin family protein [Mucilaginibacter gracilis]RKR81373.1 outer membrane protein with beta-barrel domain [Mucilaginibacter gracilis]